MDSSLSFTQAYAIYLYGIPTYVYASMLITLIVMSVEATECQKAQRIWP